MESYAPQNRPLTHVRSRFLFIQATSLLQNPDRDVRAGLGVGEGVVVIPQVITACGGHCLELMVGQE